MSDLYDHDFVQWTEDQAAALRRAKATGANLPLDWENLAEEIESLGRSQRREMASQIRRIMRHLLKLEASPASDPRAGWHSSIYEARGEIAAVLRDSPSLHRQIDAIIAEEADLAGKLAAADLSQHGEPAEAVSARLAAGGFTSEQIIGDWFPDGSP